jgi:hypothetical protein
MSASAARVNLGKRVTERPPARHSGAPARLLVIVVVALAGLVAIPATAGAVVQLQSTITVTNLTTAPDGTTPADAPPVMFHLTGPTCGTIPTDFAFSLANGESKKFPLCDANPSPVSGRFMAVEDVPAGWTLHDITCENNDPDPADFLIIDLPAATAKIELSAFNEFKSCTFNNVTPTPPVTPQLATVPSAPQVAPKAPPVTTVAGVVQRAPARVNSLAAKTSCATRTVGVTVRGRGMRDITLFVNGRRVKTVHVLSSSRTVRTRVPIARGGGVSVITARVRFRDGTPARRLTTRAKRCAAAQVKPSFTG